MAVTRHPTIVQPTCQLPAALGRGRQPAHRRIAGTISRSPMDLFGRSSSAPSPQRSCLDRRLQRSLTLVAGRLLLAFVAAACTFVVVLGGTNHTLSRATNATAAIADTHQGMLDQETGVRGFLISGDQAFLSPYTAGQSEVADGNAATLAAIQGDQVLIVAFDRDRTAQNRWVHEWAEAALANPELHTPGTDTDPAILDGGRGRFATYRAQEDMLIAMLGQQTSDAQHVQSQVLMLGGIAELCIVIAIAVAGMRDYRRMRNNEATAG